MGRVHTQPSGRSSHGDWGCLSRGRGGLGGAGGGNDVQKEQTSSETVSFYLLQRGLIQSEAKRTGGIAMRVQRCTSVFAHSDVSVLYVHLCMH